MNDQARLVFLNSCGDAFSAVLVPVVGQPVCAQDAYEVFAKVLGEQLNPDSLRSLTDTQVDEIRRFACQWLETTRIAESHIRQIVSRTLSQWAND